MTPVRPVFFVSDHTGITAEIIGKSLLSQFPDEAFATSSLPFVDNLEKANIAAQQIREAWKNTSLKPFVYSTLTDPGARAALAACGALVMDIYGHFLGMMVGEIGYPPEPLRGRFHGMGDQSDYYLRINAVNFALAADDGLSIEKYERADVILVGVSRSGKTPTCLYLAMQYGVRAANYPITEEDLEHGRLPAALAAHRDRLVGLTIAPERLRQIRQERRPDSPYASLAQCQYEVRQLIALLRRECIRTLDSTHMSIEEIAASLVHDLGLARRR